MSIHQFIYTSCNKGIDDALKSTVGDGQKLYSKDAGFSGEDYQHVSSTMFSYQPPVSSSVRLTDDLLKTFPKSYRYARLENGHRVFIDNVYGKDYTGRRYGNVFRHCLLFDSASDLNVLPVELCDHSVVRESITKEEAYRDTVPEPLPALDAIPEGSGVTFERAMEFLTAASYRVTVLKNVLFAVLSHEATHRQTLVCDTPENVVYWIACVSYLLPRDCADGLTFNTYVYDPASDHDSVLMGVFESDTAYSVDDPATFERYYVYDVVHNHLSLFDEDVLGGYEYLQDLEGIVEDRNLYLLEDFSRYVSEKTSYRGLGYGVLQAYSQYVLYRNLEDDLEDPEYLRDDVAYLLNVVGFVESYLTDPDELERYLDAATDCLNALEGVSLEGYPLMDVHRATVACCRLSEGFLDGVYALPVRILLYSLSDGSVSISEYRELCTVLDLYRDCEQTFFDGFQSCIYRGGDRGSDGVSFEKVALLYDRVSALFSVKTFGSCVSQVSRCYVPEDGVREYVRLVLDRAVVLDANLTVTVAEVLAEQYPSESRYVWESFETVVLENLPTDSEGVYGALVDVTVAGRVDKGVVEAAYEYYLESSDDVPEEVALYSKYYVRLAKAGLYSATELSDYVQGAYRTADSHGAFGNNRYTVTAMARTSELLKVVDGLVLDGGERASQARTDTIKVLQRLDRRLVLSELYTDATLMEAYSRLEPTLLDHGVECHTLDVAKLILYRDYGVKSVLDVASVRHLVFDQTLDKVTVSTNTRDLFTILSKDIVDGLESEEQFRAFMSLFKWQKRSGSEHHEVGAYCYSSLVRAFTLNAVENVDSARRYKPLDYLLRYLSKRLDDDYVDEVTALEPLRDVEHAGLKNVDRHVAASLSKEVAELWAKLKRRKGNLFGKLFT